MIIYKLFQGYDNSISQTLKPASTSLPLFLRNTLPNPCFVVLYNILLHMHPSHFMLCCVCSLRRWILIWYIIQIITPNYLVRRTAVWHLLLFWQYTWELRNQLQICNKMKTMGIVFISPSYVIPYFYISPLPLETTKNSWRILLKEFSYFVRPNSIYCSI